MRRHVTCAFAAVGPVMASRSPSPRVRVRPAVPTSAHATSSCSFLISRARASCCPSVCDSPGIPACAVARRYRGPFSSPVHSGKLNYPRASFLLSLSHAITTASGTSDTLGMKAVSRFINSLTVSPFLIAIPSRVTLLWVPVLP